MIDERVNPLLHPFGRILHAEIVNAYDPLLKRAQDCQRVRKKLPNVLLVDFYRTGDLFRVVRTLNGLPPSVGDTTSSP